MGGGNMKYQLIMLPNQPILVSDEKITKEDIPFNLGIDYDSVWQFRKGLTTDGKGNWKKIIAGIPELPSIDFSVLSEEDCKKIGWVEIERLADDYSIEVYPINGESREMVDWIESQKIVLQQGFMSGFKAAQSLNEKKFSKEDIFSILDLHTDSAPISYLKREFEKYLSQPKVFDVEVEMSCEHCIDIDSKNAAYIDSKCNSDEGLYKCGYSPKITNNSIKITKIL